VKRLKNSKKVLSRRLKIGKLLPKLELEDWIGLKKSFHRKLSVNLLLLLLLLLPVLKL
jgi:hypothetical protein